MHLNFLALRLSKLVLLPAEQASLFSSRRTTRKQLELQLTSMWPGMHRFSQLLSGDIPSRTILTSAVYGIQPFPQLQCARSEQCVATTYRRWYLEEHREGVQNDSAIFCDRSFWTSSLRCIDLQLLLYAQRRVLTLTPTRKWSSGYAADWCDHKKAQVGLD